MPNHYLFMNKERTNTSTKALILFISEEVVIKIVETIHHSSIANHHPHAQVLKFIKRIKKITRKLESLESWITYKILLHAGLGTWSTNFRCFFFLKFNGTFSYNRWKILIPNSNLFITKTRWITMKYMREIYHVIKNTWINDPRCRTRMTRESTRVATCLS